MTEKKENAIKQFINQFKQAKKDCCVVKIEEDTSGQNTSTKQ
ncbi:hypothetical protein [Alkalihalobacillus sp. TS-13]|nr:hypothetical protein [Alkalihalobacillus sp. TS-13]